VTAANRDSLERFVRRV